MKKILGLLGFSMAATLVLAGCSPVYSLTETVSKANSGTSESVPVVSETKIASQKQHAEAAPRFEEILKAVTSVDRGQLDSFFDENGTYPEDKEAYISHATALVPELKWLNGDTQDKVTGIITLFILAYTGPKEFELLPQAVYARTDGTLEIRLDRVWLVDGSGQTFGQATGINLMTMTKVDGEWYLNAQPPRTT